MTLTGDTERAMASEPTVRMTRTAWYWAFVCRDCNHVSSPGELAGKPCPSCSKNDWRNALVRKTMMTDPKPWWNVFGSRDEHCSYEERDAEGKIWLIPMKQDGA
jgi:hypothetical protein